MYYLKAVVESWLSMDATNNLARGRRQIVPDVQVAVTKIWDVTTALFLISELLFHDTQNLLYRIKIS